MGVVLHHQLAEVAAELFVLGEAALLVADVAIGHGNTQLNVGEEAGGQHVALLLVEEFIQTNQKLVIVEHQIKTFGGEVIDGGIEGQVGDVEHLLQAVFALQKLLGKAENVERESPSMLDI